MGMKPLVVLVLIVLFAIPAEAGSLARRCRRDCSGQIQACMDTGGKRRRCRRTVLKQCRTQGIERCAPGLSASTTSTVPTGDPTTTTTLMPGAIVNGCDRTTATDWRGQPQVTVTFPTPPYNSYSPPCFVVSPGTQVTFSGDFAANPLVGGLVILSGTNKIKHPDPGSPFSPTTASGSSKAFVLTQNTWPFYSDTHALDDMKGVAFVEP